MSRTSKVSKIKVPSAEQDRKIRAAAKADPDAQPLTQKQLKSMVPLKTLAGPSEVREPKVTRVGQV